MILQEYLVKLGWSIDDPSLKRFFGALASTSAKTAELTAAVVETAAAIELMVDKVARKYETLYYVSQRTGQSVKYIQSTQFAFRQIGMSADEANASIESIAATLRTQPWLRAIFGGASTPQAVASRLGKSGLPYFLQARFAEMIGMDEKTLFHLQRFAAVESAAQAEFVAHQRAAGIDPDELARKSTNLGRSLNRLETDLEILGDRMAADLIDPVERGIKLLDQAVQWITRVDAATKGWAGTLATLAGTTGGLLVLEKILRRLLGLGGTTATGSAVGGALGGKYLGGGLLKGGLYGGLAAALGVVKSDDPELKAQLRDTLGPLFYELGLSKSPNLNDTGGGATPNRFRPGAGGRAGAGALGRAQQVVDALVSAGYPIESARGIAAGLYSESGLNPGNVNSESGAAGIGQWLGTRANRYRGTFLHDVKEGSFEEQLRFLIDELAGGDPSDPQTGQAGKLLKRGGLSSSQAAETFIHLFERPGPAGEASDMSRAAPFADMLSKLTGQQNDTGTTNNIRLNSNTTVHVSGGPDVASTVKAYQGAHDQANENLVRNLQGVLR